MKDEINKGMNKAQEKYLENKYVIGCDPCATGANDFSVHICLTGPTGHVWSCGCPAGEPGPKGETGVYLGFTSPNIHGDGYLSERTTVDSNGVHDTEYFDNPKYYTPKLEEFHVGFEFEVSNDIVAGTLKVKPPKEWYKQVYGKSEPYTDDFIKFNLDNKLGMIRVKYLDKEDIESFGFKNTKHYEDELEFQFIVDDYSFYELSLYNDDHRICIEYFYQSEMVAKVTGKVNSSFLFNGIIKNKSELKKILTQLQIIKE